MRVISLAHRLPIAALSPARLSLHAVRVCHLCPPARLSPVLPDYRWTITTIFWAHTNGELPSGSQAFRPMGLEIITLGAICKVVPVAPHQGTRTNGGSPCRERRRRASSA